MKKSDLNQVVEKPNQKVAVAWKNFTAHKPPSFLNLYQILEKSSEREILKNVSGVVKVNTMVAVMGPSGAGKTTLLRSLFGTSLLPFSGRIFVRKPDMRTVFITQDGQNHLYPLLTVKETLLFASRIKKCSTIANESRISELMEVLDLKKCSENYVDNCSGGQKKRLLIAQELLSDVMPSLILLDEPTSGLDSSSSHTLLNLLQRLAKCYELSIVASIHQPSYKLLTVFDDVYILNRDGQFIFNGPPEALEQQLKACRIVVPEGQNPMDALMAVASHGTLFRGLSESFQVSDSEENLAIVQESKIESFIFATAIKSLKINTKRQTEVNLRKFQVSRMQETKRLHQNEECFSWLHTWFLFLRLLKNDILRNPLLVTFRIALYLLLALFIAIVFDSDIGKESGCVPHFPTQIPQEVLCFHMQAAANSIRLFKGNVKFLVCNILYMMFTSSMTTLLVFASDMNLFLTEHRNGWYTAGCYYWAKNLVEVLIQLPLAFIVCLFMYWKTNQPGLDSVTDLIPVFGHVSRFAQFAFLFLLSTCVTQELGFAASALFTNKNFSVLFGIFVLAFNILFGGLIIRVNTGYLVNFLSLLAFSKFSFKGALVAIYGQNRCANIKVNILEKPMDFLSSKLDMVHTLLDTERAAVFNKTIGHFKRFVRQRIIFNDLASVRTKSIVFTAYEEYEVPFAQCILGLVLHLLFWRLLTFLALWYRVHNENLYWLVSSISRKVISCLKDYRYLVVLVIWISIILSPNLSSKY